MGPAVTLPLGSSAPVIGIGKLNQSYASPGVNVYESDGHIRILARLE